MIRRHNQAIRPEDADDENGWAAALLALIESPDWFKDAACRGMGANGDYPNLWFPERGENKKNAVAVCQTCPTAQQCAERGAYENFGIWGAKSERQRRAARKGTRNPNPRPPRAMHHRTVS